jgi:hypothetical protein
MDKPLVGLKLLARIRGGLSPAGSRAAIGLKPDGGRIRANYPLSRLPGAPLSTAPEQLGMVLIHLVLL